MDDPETSEALDAPEHENTLAEKINEFFDNNDEDDWMLAWIIGHAEAFGLEFGITITVSGTVITGTLISGIKYFERMHEVLLRSSSKSIASSLTQWKHVYSHPNENSDIYTESPRFIHMDNARHFLSNGQTIPSKGVLWRGKLASVDGFSLGTLESANDSPLLKRW